MGLDITAYSRLKHIGMHTDDGWCEEDGHVMAYTYLSFPRSFRGIPILNEKAVRDSERFMVGGCFEITPQTKMCRFRAGSYSGYSAWRDHMRSQFNVGLDPEKPFYELIYFSDSEGTIGPEAARDLYWDFFNCGASYGGEGYRLELYTLWMHACELAMDDGLIDFH